MANNALTPDTKPRVLESSSADIEPSDSLREQKAKRAIRINRFLSESISGLAQGNDLRAAMDCIFMGLARELGAAHVFLFRHDPAAHTIRLECSYIDGRLRSGPSSEEMALWGEPFPDDITPAWKIMTERRGLFTPDMALISAAEFAWPGALEYAARFELSDIGHIVLFAGSVPVGSIGIGLRGGRKITA